MPINQAKLDKLKQQQGDGSRIGGKGTARRKKKVVHKTATDDRKLQNSLNKLNVNGIQGIEEVNMFKDDGRVLHFANPKVQASLTANTFAISGSCEEKPITDLLPGIFNQLVSAKAAESFGNFRKFGQGFPGQGGLGDIDEGDDGQDDDIPDLVDENFEEVSKQD